MSSERYIIKISGEPAGKFDMLTRILSEHNIRSYLITALYNAPTTINNYYKQEVQHDLFNQE